MNLKKKLSMDSKFLSILTFMKLSNLTIPKFTYRNMKVKHCENLIICCGSK